MFSSKQFIAVQSVSRFALRICLSEGRENPIIHYSLLNYVHVWMIYESENVIQALVFFPPRQLNYIVYQTSVVTTTV